jgi:hypothetical protein
MTGWVFPVRLFHSRLSAGFQRRTKRLVKYKALSVSGRHGERDARRKALSGERGRDYDRKMLAARAHVWACDCSAGPSLTAAGPSPFQPAVGFPLVTTAGDRAIGAVPLSAVPLP